MAAPNTFVNSYLRANRDANVVSNTYNYGSQSPDPISILREQVAFGALHDSAERVDPPKCHAETRTAVLNLINQWAEDPSDTAQPVFWLTGAAGAGKSAIAQTLVEKWKKDEMKVLSFFFWRTSSERNHKTKLVPTLSYQLSKLCLSAIADIKEAVGSGDIFRKNLEAQFDELLLRPLQNVPTDQRPVIVVIDGLDECCVDLLPTKDFAGQDYRSQQREILDAVAFTCQKRQVLSPRFLIVSRPEQVMRTSFTKPPLQKLTHQLSLNEAPNVNEDLHLFLACSFEDTRRSYPSLPSTWPGGDRLSELVRRSSGQFIYPATVVKYITYRRQYPEKSLQDVLNLGNWSKNPDRHPLADLDDLYALILKSVATESLRIVRLILGILCHFTAGGFKSNHSGLHGESDIAKSPHVLEELLFLSHGEVMTHLTDLHSILHIPPAEKPHDTIRPVHATLSEYLQDQSRSRDLHISRASVYPSIYLFTLRHLNISRQETKLAITKIPDDDMGMCYYFLYFSNDNPMDVPYSKELRTALQTFLKDEIGGYTSLAVGSKFTTKFGIDIHRCASCGHAHYVDLHFKRGAVDYLLASNTFAFEPSPWRRFWLGRRLGKAKRILETRMNALKKEHDDRRRQTNPAELTVQCGGLY